MNIVNKASGMVKNIFGDAKIIYGFPGIGKSWLCKNYKNFLDLESSEYHWIVSDDIIELSVEERKGLNCKENIEWPNNYYQAISMALNKYDYIFVSYEGIKYCKMQNIQYVRIFPTKEQKEIYINRFKRRENSKNFIYMMGLNFEKFVRECTDDCNCVKIELLEDEYLEQCLKRIGIIR